jgi:hypothetical protein
MGRVHRLQAEAILFYIRDLSRLGFWYDGGVGVPWNQSPMDTKVA